MIYPFNSVNLLYELYARSGEILIALMLSALIMWSLIIERYLYFAFSRKHIQARYLRLWQTTHCKTIAERQLLKFYYLSEYSLQTGRGITWIQLFTKTSLLLGLLGTVQGLISVFESQLFTVSDPTLRMSGSIAHTVIPTAVGLSLSLSGLLFANHLKNLAADSLARLDCLLT